MTRIILELEEEQAKHLVEEARLRNLSVEELARAGVLALVTDRSSWFADALEYVLQKSAPLYERLG